MSRSLSATGWSAGGTLLAALGVSLTCSLAGSAAGVAAAAGRVPASAGAVTTSDGLLAAAFSAEVAVSAAAGLASALKSLMLGGGRFAGSGRGIAASIASSAALLRTGSPWANAELAETASKVAATLISKRSNPARLFEQSRIVTHTPWAKLPRQGTAPGFVRSFRRSAGITGFQAAFTQRLQPTFVLSVFDRPAREGFLRRRFLCMPRWGQRHAG